MTLDEAIEHAEQMAELAKWGPLEDEYQQQLEWLKELKKHRAVRAVQDLAIANMRAVVLESEQLKSENASLRGAAMGLGELCDQLKAENKKMRKFIQSYVDDYVHDNCGSCYGGPCEDCDCWLSNCTDEFREWGIEVSYE